MSPSPIELGALNARHAPALGRHLLALNGDDRYARFGHPISDDAILRWVHRIRWRTDRWTGAWGGSDALFMGALQLAPTRQSGIWELALTVAAPVRHQGVGTALLAAALRDMSRSTCQALVCQHGHPALKRMAQHLGLALSEHCSEPRATLHRPAPVPTKQKT